MESEETKKMKLEVLKIAAQDHLSGGDADRAVEVAGKLWAFFARPGGGEPSSSEVGRTAA